MGAPQGTRKPPADAPPKRVHILAVNRAIKAAKLPETADALVETYRELARQMDAARGNPSTRLSMAYLSAGREFQRVLRTTADVKRGPNPFDELRKRREGREAG
jgi:hypothetical protein